jgi:hypothetical protein
LGVKFTVWNSLFSEFRVGVEGQGFEVKDFRNRSSEIRQYVVCHTVLFCVL